MFAVAVWDGERRRLVLARDRFGIKPLYYRDGAGEFAFASELKALRRLPGLSRELDLDALEAFLAFNAIHGAAHDLPRGPQAAARARARARGRRGRGSSATRSTGPSPAAGAARRAVGGAGGASCASACATPCARTSSPTCPVGVLLSGGIDSSALAALAAHGEQRAASRRSRSASRSARSPRSSSRARSPQRYGTDHHELVVEPDAAELLPTIAAAFDEPFADSSALPTYLVSELAAQHVKVALSRRGRRRAVRRLRDLRRRPAGAARRRRRAAARRRWSSGCRAARAACRSTTSSSASRAPRTCRRSSATTAGRRSSRPTRAPSCCGPSAAAREDPLDVYRARWAETEGADTLARLQDVDRAIYLVDDLLVKTDRMSMAHSLELRVPFLDPVVAELALALPVAARVRGFAKKRLLRAAVEPLVGRDDRARAQEGLLDPRRRLAARRARAVLPRGPRRRAAARARATSSRRRSRA